MEETGGLDHQASLAIRATQGTLASTASPLMAPPDSQVYQGPLASRDLQGMPSTPDRVAQDQADLLGLREGRESAVLRGSPGRKVDQVSQDPRGIKVIQESRASPAPPGSQGEPSQAAPMAGQESRASPVQLELQGKQASVVIKVTEEIRAPQEHRGDLQGLQVFVAPPSQDPEALLGHEETTGTLAHLA